MSSAVSSDTALDKISLHLRTLPFKHGHGKRYCPQSPQPEFEQFMLFFPSDFSAD